MQNTIKSTILAAAFVAFGAGAALAQTQPASKGVRPDMSPKPSVTCTNQEKGAGTSQDCQNRNGNSSNANSSGTGGATGGAGTGGTQN